MAEATRETVVTPPSDFQIFNIVMLQSQFNWGKLDVSGYASSDVLLQFKKLTFTTEIITPLVNGAPLKLHRVVFDAGLRLIGTQFNAVPADSIDESMIAAEILAHFAVDYHVESGECDPAWFESFVRKNSVIHFWPYWREFVHNIGIRTGIPTIALPLFKPDLIPLLSE